MKQLHGRDDSGEVTYAIHRLQQKYNVRCIANRLEARPGKKSCLPAHAVRQNGQDQEKGAERLEKGLEAATHSRVEKITHERGASCTQHADKQHTCSPYLLASGINEAFLFFFTRANHEASF